MEEQQVKRLHFDFLAGIVTSIGDGLIATDLEAKIVFMNEAAEQIIGCSPAESIGLPITEIFCVYSMATRERLADPIGEVLAAGMKVGLTDGAVIFCSQNLPHYISATATPIYCAGLLSGAAMVFRDVTRYRVLEERCKSEEQNLRSLFEAAPVGMILLNEQLLITESNDSALALFGLERSQMIGKIFGNGISCKGCFQDKQDCGHGDPCQICEIRRAIGFSFEELPTVGLEWNMTFIRNAQEQSVWFRASVAPVTINGVKNAVVTLADITISKNREIALTKARDFYLEMFENFPVFIWRFDFTGSNNFINRHWCRATGQCAEAARGYGWLKQVHPQDQQKLLAFTDDVLPDGCELRIMDLSGQYRWYHCVNKLYSGISGSPEGFIGMGVDITGRKQAEEALSRYQTLAESTLDIILFIDRESGRVMEANQAALQAYGFSQDELLTKTVNDLRGNKPEVQWQMPIADEKGLQFETIHFRKDGSSFPVEVRSKGATVDGKRLLVSVIRDITERKASEAELTRAKEGAEAANQSKSEFLANMSHEIRTPLNGMIGMIDLTLLSELTTDQKENLTTAKSCAKSLLAIINDILDFSKMEAGKLVIEHIDFKIRELLAETIKAHSHHATGKSLDFSYTVFAGIPDTIAGDPLRLTQVLNNLINNAIKFTESGEVVVSVRKIADEGALLFSVRDTGIGISTESMDKLFKSFSQVDGSITRRYGGTGLGLVISRQLVEMMGGKMWVESQQGAGSTFSFTIRLNPASGIVRKPAIRSGYRQNVSILLAEDDVISRTVTAKLLQEAGHTVTTAINGVEAIEKFVAGNYDVILMDIQMPCMDGLAATKHIRSTAKGRSIPIIALTAHALAGDRERFLVAGMDEYIAKPLQIEELLEKIASIRRPRLESLRINTAGDIVDASPVVQAEMEIAMGNLVKLIQTAEQTEGYRLEELAHKIKQLANQAGIDGVKSLAFRAELAARRGDFKTGKQYFQQLQDVCETYKKAHILP